MTKRRVIIILGSTASGKSAIGIRLAKRFHGIIISADSRQVYRGMNIGTGKVTRREMAGVPHYLLDVASPRVQYSVLRYARDVHCVLKGLPATTPVFLVGGSPFYLDAVTKPGAFSPVPPDLKLRRRLATKTLPQLISLLRQRNPRRLQTIDAANRRRLIRAIEIANHHGPVRQVELPPMRVLRLGIRRTRSALYRRIDQRVDARLRQGMVAEVARLHRQGVSWKRLDDFGLEYRYLSRFLRGQLSRVDAVRQLKSAIKDFAKRQMTWWRRDASIHWVQKDRAMAILVRHWLQRPPPLPR